MELQGVPPRSAGPWYPWWTGNELGGSASSRRAQRSSPSKTCAPEASRSLHSASRFAVTRGDHTHRQLRRPFELGDVFEQQPVDAEGGAQLRHARALVRAAEHLLLTLHAQERSDVLLRDDAQSAKLPCKVLPEGREPLLSSAQLKRQRGLLRSSGLLGEACGHGWLGEAQLVTVKAMPFFVEYPWVRRAVASFVAIFVGSFALNDVLVPVAHAAPVCAAGAGQPSTTGAARGAVAGVALPATAAVVGAVGLGANADLLRAALCADSVVEFVVARR